MGLYTYFPTLFPGVTREGCMDKAKKFSFIERQKKIYKGVIF